MRLLSVLDTLSRHTPTNFAAPVLTNDTTRVLVLQDSIPYWYDVQIGKPGWYELEPTGYMAVDKRFLTWLERIKYLDQLKRFMVFALYPVGESEWLCSPYNISDAEQRGWAHGHPRRMYLVEGTIKPFDIVQTRILGSVLLYDRVTAGYFTDSQHLPARTHAKAFVDQRLEHLRKEDERRAREQAKETEQGRIEQSLEFMGAKLENWNRDVDGYEVTWSHNGRTHTMTLDQKLHVKSAGVCLAGRDNWHTLSSIVAVMEDRDAGRGGYDGYDDY